MVADTNAFLIGNSSLANPTPVADGIQVLARFSNKGEVYTHPVGSWRAALAAAGCYFEFHNATLDAATTIAGHAAPVVADIDATFVKATFHIGNLNAATDKKNIYLDWLEIEVATAGANGTDAWWADQTDLATNYTSGGTALTVVNPNTGSNSTLASDVLRILGGPVVIPVETASCRKLGFSRYLQAIEVAADRKIFSFIDPIPPVAHVAAPTGRSFVFRRPPVVLTPGYAYSLGIAAAAQDTAGVYKIRGGFYYV